MMDFIRAGGYWFMIPLVVIGVVVVALAARSWQRVRREPTGPDPIVETGIDAVLFWGVFGVVVGLFGTLGGIAQAASAIERVSEVSSALVWGGIKVALHPTIFSLGIFGLALLLWFGLRVRYRRAIGATA